MPNFRYIVRAALREPLQTCAVVICLAIGIGTATAVFAFLDHVFISGFPFIDADRIVRIWEEPAKGPGRRRLGMSYPHYLALRNHSQSLERVALYGGGQVSIASRETKIKVAYAAVTASFFPILGILPQSGRWLSATRSEQPEREAVLSESFYRRLFGEAPLAGQYVQIAEKDYAAVGIMSDHFAFPNAETQVWLPYRPPPPDQADNLFARCLAERKKGSSNAQVAAEVAAFFDRRSPVVESLWQATYGSLKEPLLWLGAGIGMVLLIALLNAATLQLTRINRRLKDFGIRAALGESGARLAGDLQTENLLLAATGGLLGFVTFAGAFVFVVQHRPQEVPGLHAFTLAAPRPLLLLAIGALAAAVALAGFSFCFVGRKLLQDRLGLAGSFSARSSVRLRANGLVVSSQLAITVVLLIAAGTLSRSFLDAIAVDLGYRPDGSVAALLVLPEDGYPQRETQQQVVDALLGRIETMDGIDAVGISSSLPGVARGSMTIQHPDQEGLSPQVAYAQVSPGFFKALGLRLISGRLLSSRETEPTVVVNQSLAESYLHPEPLGQMLLLGPERP